ncbi:hypothetical protein [Flavobacterium sp.]|uniref:hypothetical protein n=1 Tax=Flavobacterium sp. TaxID=239 RepID=UPI0025E07F41|nr:hypothetical protein [Flavobacterium sp.]
METLLRQKVGKSKHNFLITKYFCREKRAKKQEKRFDNVIRGAKQSGANGSGILGFHIPAIRATWLLLQPACRQAGRGARSDFH